jgi:hypothetical protein
MEDTRRVRRDEPSPDSLARRGGNLTDAKSLKCGRTGCLLVRLFACSAKPAPPPILQFALSG